MTQNLHNYSPEVHIDSNLKRWFTRNLGLWKSQRQYIFHEDEIYNLTMFLKIEFVEIRDDCSANYKFSWWPLEEYKFFSKHSLFRKQGEMNAYLSGHQLIRDEFYLSSSKGISNIRQIDEHELIFDSNYDDSAILELPWLVNEDKNRYRFIYSWKNEKLEIVESHHEIKLESYSNKN